MVEYVYLFISPPLAWQQMHRGSQKTDKKRRVSIFTSLPLHEENIKHETHWHNWKVKNMLMDKRWNCWWLSFSSSVSDQLWGVSVQTMEDDGCVEYCFLLESRDKNKHLLLSPAAVFTVFMNMSLSFNTRQKACFQKYSGAFTTSNCVKKKKETFWLHRAVTSPPNCM